VSTRLRQAMLRMLRTLRVTHFRATSGLGHPYICYLGDFIGENPYYNRDSGRPEIVLMAAWCRGFERPVIVDVGGNLGFFATQLAQLLRQHQPVIYSFEPVPYTFQRLAQSVRTLGLTPFVQPINCALSSAPGLVCVSYSEKNTMLSRVSRDGGKERGLDAVTWAAAVTVDQAMGALDDRCTLMKVDVEGHEVRVLRGAQGELGRLDRPALCCEINPEALCGAGHSVRELAEMLTGYRCFYLNDWEGQRLALGEPIADVAGIDWTCNIFAVPDVEAALRHWEGALAQATRDLDMLRAKDLARRRI
jgi:FkbM family methyltransferase